MQEVFDIIVLSLAQGILEFLPVSSSAHLKIINHLIGIKDFKQLKFFTELATFIVIFIYFLPIIKTNLKGVIKKQKLAIYFFLKIIISTLPFIFAFFFLHNTFNNISLFLILGSLLMIIAEKTYKGKSELLEINFKQAFFIGVFQIFSIFSGFSRSGSTICGGLICGLKRAAAVQYSFLISLPLTFCSLVYDFYKLNITNYQAGIITFISCFLIGFISAKILIKFLSNHKLYYFVYYRVALVILIIFIL